VSAVCGQIHATVAGMRRHRFPFNAAELPDNGVYLLFEKGERAHDGDRIVRVGSHTGPANLVQRLTEHFLVENKDRSILRKNVGRALLARDGDPFIEQWEWDLTSKVSRDEHEGRVDAEKLEAVERRVTEYITRNCSFVVLPAGRGKAARLTIEAGLIATVAQCRCCGPSADWLGRFSPKATIRRIGLWQIQHARGDPLAAFPPG